MPPQPRQLVLDDNCAYDVIVHYGSAMGCRYGTLVDLDGERREWLGVLELSMEIPCAYAA